MTATAMPKFDPSPIYAKWADATETVAGRPQKLSDVEQIKASTEAVMDFIKSLPGDERCKALALTNYEQAAMWAVKSLSVK